MKKKLKKILLITFFLILILIIGIIIFIKTSFNNNIPILAYHAVVENPQNDMEVSIENFEYQMKYLSDNNYTALSLDEFYEWKKGNIDIKGKKVIITFDDGSESYYENALLILEKYNLKSVNFLINSRINKNGYLSEEDIKVLKENPLVELENHSYNLHNHDNAYGEDYNIYNDDLKKISEKEYQYYAYPFGISNDEYKKALKDNGYKLAFKYSPSKWANKKQDDYEVRRVPVYNSTSKLKFKLKVLLNIK